MHTSIIKNLLSHVLAYVSVELLKWYQSLLIWNKKGNSIQGRGYELYSTIVLVEFFVFDEKLDRVSWIWSTESSIFGISGIWENGEPLTTVGVTEDFLIFLMVLP